MVNKLTVCRQHYSLYLQICVMVLFTMGCKKYLEKKPDSSLVIPTQLKDVQALLDNNTVMNNNGNYNGEVSSDNYYLQYQDWAAMPDEGDRRLYTWEPDYVITRYPNSWSQAYDAIFFTNTAIDALDNIPRVKDPTKWDDLKGQALFFRAKAFFETSVVWCVAFDPSTANRELGIPLRLTPDFNTPSVRSDLNSTFEQILADLKAAVSLLPESTVAKTRPNKAAAFGMLARICLYMDRIEDAGNYADSCLQRHNKLIDFNTLDTTANFPFKLFNDEVIFHSQAPVATQLSATRARIDTVLMASFDTNDIRRSAFFRRNSDGSRAFKGSYTGGITLFTGIATNEMLVTAAESNCLRGNLNQARTLINELLLSRWKSGNFVPVTSENADSLYRFILSERRKELIYRGIRWMDLKRLNLQNEGITLKRRLDDKEYVLLPKSLRYAVAIPEDVIEQAGIEQNPR